jgi:hypothetical protein
MMKRLKLLCLAALTVFAVAIATASSASAAAPLPTLLTLTTSGEGAPVTIKSLTNTFATQLGVANANALEGKGVLVQLYWTNLNINSGLAEILLTEVLQGPKTGKKCRTPGDPIGEVLLPSTTEWHLVYTTTSPLKTVILILIPEFLLECEPFGTGVKVKVRGSNISTGSPENTEVLTTEEFGSNTKCNLATTTPEITQWLNNKEETQKAKLEFNSGAGFEKGCLNVEGEVKLQPSKMIEVMG